MPDGVLECTAGCVIGLAAVSKVTYHYGRARSRSSLYFRVDCGGHGGRHRFEDLEEPRIDERQAAVGCFRCSGLLSLDTGDDEYLTE